METHDRIKKHIVNCINIWKHTGCILKKYRYLSSVNKLKHLQISLEDLKVLKKCFNVYINVTFIQGKVQI